MISMTQLIDTYFEVKMKGLDPITKDEDIEIVSQMAARDLKDNLPEAFPPILFAKMKQQNNKGNWKFARSLLWNAYFYFGQEIPIQIIGISRTEESFSKFISSLEDKIG